MAELETNCCPPEAQATCCEPEDKSECCGPQHDAACDCSAGAAETAPATANATLVRETVREKGRTGKPSVPVTTKSARTPSPGSPEG